MRVISARVAATANMILSMLCLDLVIHALSPRSQASVVAVQKGVLTMVKSIITMLK